MVYSISIGGAASEQQEKQILVEIEAFVKKYRKNIAGAVWSGTSTGHIQLTEV
jgi:hypothetical protein